MCEIYNLPFGFCSYFLNSFFLQNWVKIICAISHLSVISYCSAFESSVEDFNESAENSESSEDVAPDVEDICDNTTGLADYDLSTAFTERFYTEKSVGLWYLYVNRELLVEKNVDPCAFGRQNLIAFLRQYQLYSTVSAVIPYC